MREQRVFLEHGVDTALMGRDIVDLITLKIHLTALGRFKARDDAQGGRLTAAGRTEQGNELLVIDVEADIVQYHLIGILEIDILQGYDRILLQLSNLLGLEPPRRFFRSSPPIPVIAKPEAVWCTEGAGCANLPVTDVVWRKGKDAARLCGIATVASSLAMTIDTHNKSSRIAMTRELCYVVILLSSLINPQSASTSFR